MNIDKNHSAVRSIVSLMLVWCIVFTGVVSLLASDLGTEPATGVVGDLFIGEEYSISEWTIEDTTPVPVTYNITVGYNGTLTLKNSGLIFSNHAGPDGIGGTADDVIFTLNIEDGGTLIMEDSIITTNLELFWHTDKLDVTVKNGGKFIMRDDSILQFPGTFTVDNGQFIMENSNITGFDGLLLDAADNQNNIVDTFYEDDNDDSPILYFVDSDVQIYDSVIEKIYDSSNWIGNLTWPIPYRYPNVTDPSCPITVDLSYTLSREPSLIHPLDTTVGEDISSLMANDIYFYEVDNGEQLYIDGFDVSGIENTITDVTLNVMYWTDPGYTGNGQIWYYNTVTGGGGITIVPTDTNGINQTESYDLFTALIDTVPEIELLELNFTNSNSAQTVHFDKIWLDITLSNATRYNITVAGNSKFTAINSYLGVDTDSFNVLNGATKNELVMGNGAQAYLYGVTIEEPEAQASFPGFVPMRDTYSLVPKDKGTLDNTSQPINYLVWDDSSTVPATPPYTVDSFGSGNNYMHIDNFKTNGLTGELSYVVLYVEWEIAGPLSYVNSVNWSTEDMSTNQSTGIVPNGPATQIDSFNLYANGVDTFEEIATLNVTYENLANNLPANFTHIWIEIIPEIKIHRMLNIDITDATGSPVVATDINTYYMPTMTAINTPSVEVLNYLGKTAGNFNQTDDMGQATLPLMTEWINHTTFVQSPFPNSEFFGIFKVQITHPSLTENIYKDVAFDQYPVMNETSNSKNLEASFSDAAYPSPSATDPSILYINETVTITGYTITSGRSIVINTTGELIIRNDPISKTKGGLHMSMASNERNYILVRGNGGLYVQESGLTANNPLNIYLEGNAEFFVSGNSTVQIGRTEAIPIGDGNYTYEQYYGAVVTKDNSNLQFGNTDLDGLMTFEGNIYGEGDYVNLYMVNFESEYMHLNATYTTHFWSCEGDADLILPANGSLDLTKQNVLTYDFRDIDFYEPEGWKLSFDGDQTVSFTNVGFTEASSTVNYTADVDDIREYVELSDNAKLSIYWYVNASAIDGAGNLLKGVSLTATSYSEPLSEYNNNSQYDAEGWENFRVLSEEWTTSGENTCSTFIKGDMTTVTGDMYFPDYNITLGVVSSNTEALLVFSSLTPDLFIENTDITFNGRNSLTEAQQPVGQDMQITARIHNQGLASVSDVQVSFFMEPVGDSDGDGAIDITDYSIWIGNRTVDVNALESIPVAIDWVPEDAKTYDIYVVVDPENDIQGELFENNNIAHRQLSIFAWPDLEVTETAVGFNPTPQTEEDATALDTLLNAQANQGSLFSSPIVAGANTTISAVIYNNGDIAGANVDVEFYNGTADPENLIGTDSLFLVGATGYDIGSAYWTPEAPGQYNITIRALSRNDTAQNTDYNFTNNEATVSVNVSDKPDLMIDTADIELPEEPIIEGRNFTVNITIHNIGNSTASNFKVLLYDWDEADPLNSTEIGNRTIEEIGMNRSKRVMIVADGVMGIDDNHTLLVVVDPELNLTDGKRGNVSEMDETNNNASVNFTVTTPQAEITYTVDRPMTINPDSAPLRFNITVTDLETGEGIEGVELEIIVYDQNGTVYSDYQYTDANGEVLDVEVPIPQQPGDYTVEICATELAIDCADTYTFEVIVEGQRPIPWLLIAIIALIIAGMIGGVSFYLYRYGLGNIVECGECGAFIPEASKKCPKCGVEFEMGTAKCSECQAWIPATATTCPECGAVFTGEELEGMTYEEKMRQRYEEIVDEYREMAKVELGGEFSEDEFQNWWMQQPTYISFENWLEQEEKRIGSFPCPTCGTLNSIDAQICHKCGTPFESRFDEIGEGKEEKPPKKEEQKEPEAPTPAEPETKVEPKPVERREEVEPKEKMGVKPTPVGETAKTPAPVPKVVVKKPVEPGKVVPKKVVKKPLDKTVVQKKVVKKPIEKKEE